MTCNCKRFLRPAGREIEVRQLTQQQIKKSHDLAEKLSTRIVRGEFQSGEKLRQDLIAREFGVSQVTVREALLSLASKGLAISLARRGMCVAPMDHDAVEELRTMRCALEPIAVYKSVPNLTPMQVTEIEKLYERCNAAETSHDWEEANRCFHMAIISACRMPRLIAEIGNLQLLYSWHFNMHHTAKWRRRDDPDHAAILAAIKERDAERARAILQRHLMRLS